MRLNIIQKKYQEQESQYAQIIHYHNNSLKQMKSEVIFHYSINYGLNRPFGPGT